MAEQALGGNARDVVKERMPHVHSFWRTETCGLRSIASVLHDRTNQRRTFCALDTYWKLFGRPYLLSLDGSQPKRPRGRAGRYKAPVHGHRLVPRRNEYLGGAHSVDARKLGVQRGEASLLSAAQFPKPPDDGRGFTRYSRNCEQFSGRSTTSADEETLAIVVVFSRCRGESRVLQHLYRGFSESRICGLRNCSDRMGRHKFPRWAQSPRFRQALRR